MTTSSSPLFRAEVAEHRAERLQGTINLATPMSWQTITALIVVVVVAAGVLLVVGSYARVEVAAGTIALDKGVAAIVPSRAGIISGVSVADGQRVTAGQALVRVRAEEALADGPSAPARMRAALRAQDERLSAQGASTIEAAAQERGRLLAQIAGADAELIQLASQIVDQRTLVEAARADFAGARGIADRGFISRRDLDAREASLVGRRQQLAQLEQLAAAKRSEAAGARRAIAQASAAAEAQVAGTQSARAALVQQIAQADLASGYVLTSPVAGTVTALTARLGQSIAGEQQLMMIVPDGARMRAEIYVPTSAAAFVAPGQEVRLAIDAFPYATFGTVRGRIIEVSGATVVRSTSAGPTPAYLVVAALPRSTVSAFGREQRLMPGMTFTARIVTERRSLLRWLFEPLFAVRNR